MKKYLIFCLILWIINSTEAQDAKCDYKNASYFIKSYKITNVPYYKCDLDTRKANYDEKLTRIYGQHMSGHSDADVKWIGNYKDNKLKTFSSIFCQKFPNLEVININNTEVESIDEDSLLNCTNLNTLFLFGNKVRELPKNLLNQSSKLTNFWIYNNELTTLPENLFQNQTKLEDLELNNNQINFLPSNIFHPLVKLEVLYLKNNKLQSITPDWFVTLQNLKWLSLNKNQISKIPSKCFASLQNLKILWLNENRIKTLKSDNFDGLQNLQILNLHNNEISDLPVGVFTPLKNLQKLYLYNNNLTSIHSDSFGIHDQLTMIWLQNNKINAIDAKFINNTAISFLNMINNICSESTLNEKNKSIIMQELQNCFNNYKLYNENTINLTTTPAIPVISANINLNEPQNGIERFYSMLNLILLLVSLIFLILFFS